MDIPAGPTIPGQDLPKTGNLESQKKVAFWCASKRGIPAPAVPILPRQALSFSGNHKQHLPTKIQNSSRKKKKEFLYKASMYWSPI